MNPIDKARIMMEKSCKEALGFLDLAIEQQKHGKNVDHLKQQAIKALQRFSDNDELIDALYDDDGR